jgi:hypothetical protein
MRKIRRYRLGEQCVEIPFTDILAKGLRAARSRVHRYAMFFSS